MSRAGRITLLVCAALVLLGRSAAAQEAVEYYATDALGSVRVVYAANGSLKGRMDFGPYGEQLATREGVGDKVFAQVTFDAESAMAYAEARMLQSRTGRFNATDPVFDALDNPQKWNRYSYAVNRPLTLVDRHGTNAASGFEPSPSQWMCSAESSYQDCGGDDLFWPESRGGGGGFFTFGDSYAWAVRQGYDRRMPADLWLGLVAHNQRVDQAFANARSTGIGSKPEVTTTYEIRTDDGTVVKVAGPQVSDATDPLGMMAQHVDAQSGAMAKPLTYGVIIGGSAAAGAFGVSALSVGEAFQNAVLWSEVRAPGLTQFATNFLETTVTGPYAATSRAAALHAVWDFGRWADGLLSSGREKK